MSNPSKFNWFKSLRYTLAILAGIATFTAVATFIAILTGAASGADLRSGVWQFIAPLPWIGFTLAVALIITLIIMLALSRSRELSDLQRRQH